MQTIYEKGSRMRNVVFVVCLFFASGLVGLHSANSEDYYVVNGQMVDQSGIPIAVDSVKPLDAAGNINFDDLAPCIFDAAIPVPPTFYQSYGFILKGPNATDGGAILNECSSFGVTGHSSPNFLAFNCASKMSNGGVPFLPERIIFTPAVSGVSLKVGVGKGSSVDQSVKFTAKNALGEVIGTQTVTLRAAMTTVQFSPWRKGKIKKVVITRPEGSTTCAFVIDDITTTP
jgi:hypothetical protein